MSYLNSGVRKWLWKMAGVIAVGALFGPGLLRWGQALSFRNRLRTYSSVYYKPADWSTPDGTMPFRTGRVLVIDVTRVLLPGDVMGVSEHKLIAVADAWFKLPSDIRARSPEELDTLIHYSVRWHAEDDPEGNQEPPARMTVTAYDMRRQVKIGTMVHKYPRTEDKDQVLADLVRKMELRQ